jgi:8-oxo-dGTP pyrophosphatase MutT (NUDIX family)
LDASALLAEYAARHGEGPRSRDASALGALFREDGEVVFHGVSVPTAVGPAAVERLFRERGPAEGLELGDVVAEPTHRAQAVYGWRSAPGLVRGTLRLLEEDGAIRRLDVVVLRGGPKPARPREAARALIVSPDRHLLLLPTREPATRIPWWVTPGGGVEPGETALRAMRREVREETGLVLDDRDWPVATLREHVFTWGDAAWRQRETYFLVRRDARETTTPTASDRGSMGPPRWWDLEELRRTTKDVFGPPRLAALLETLLERRDL